MSAPRHPLLAATMVVVALLAGCSSDDNQDSGGSDGDSQRIELVDPQAAEQAIDDDNPVVLDIRTPAEFDQGHIEGAQNIDYYQNTFTSELEQLDKDAHYVMYCQTGNRSAKAAEIMRELGFTHVDEIGGGITAWQNDGLPVERN